MFTIFNQLKASNESNIIFTPNQNNLNNFLEIIKSFGELNEYNNYHFRRYPNKKIYEKFIITGEKRNIMTKIGNDETIGTICEYELDKSIEEHKWKIKLLNIKNKELMVGVAPIEFDINSSSYNSCGWYLYCYGKSYLYSGPPFNYSSKQTNLSNINDEVIVVMNMKKRTLKFIIIFPNEFKVPMKLFNEFSLGINSIFILFLSLYLLILSFTLLKILILFSILIQSLI